MSLTFMHALTTTLDGTVTGFTVWWRTPDGRTQRHTEQWDDELTMGEAMRLIRLMRQEVAADFR